MVIKHRHVTEDVGPQHLVLGQLGEPESLDVVPLGQAVSAAVEGHEAAQVGQPGGSPEQVTPYLVVVAPAKQWAYLLVRVVHERRPGVPTAESLVGGAERVTHRPQQIDISRSHPPRRAGARNTLAVTGEIGRESCRERV